MTERLVSFIDVLKEDNQIKDVSNHGYCRLWTKRAAELAHDFFESNEWEIVAREISVTPSLDHTFLRVRHVKNEELSYFYDGTGTFNFEPYYGSEKNSPPHFKNNRLDRFSNYF